jgi:hypothetical protein
MEEENDPLQSSEMWLQQAEKLVARYKKLKTLRAKSKLLPQLEYMLKRISFEKKEVKKLMNEDYGNTFGETTGGY